MGGDLLEVQRIYFLKDFQGGGRGSQLIELAEKIAQEHNKHKIWLGICSIILVLKHFYNVMDLKWLVNIIFKQVM